MSCGVKLVSKWVKVKTFHGELIRSQILWNDSDESPKFIVVFPSWLRKDGLRGLFVGFSVVFLTEFSHFLNLKAHMHSAVHTVSVSVKNT